MSTLSIAAVQYDIQWLDQQTNFKHLEELLSDYFNTNSGVDLLLLPETFSTGFCINRQDVQEPENGGTALIWLKKIAQQYNLSLIHI